MTRARTKSDTPKPRKKLPLDKKTLRDLETRGNAHRVKGGLRNTSM